MTRDGLCTSLFFLHTVEGTLKPQGGPDKVRGTHGTVLVLVRAAPTRAQSVPFLGDVRTLVPVRAM